MFVQVLHFAQANQLSQFGTVSLDGTNLHANASRHRALSCGHAEKLEAQLKQDVQDVQELLALAESADHNELPEGLSVPAEMARREDQLAAIAAAKAKIEPLIAVKREAHHPHWQDRFTEPEPIAEAASEVDRIMHALKTPAGTQAYALRKQTVEPVFGIVKSVMKIRQFMLRGLANVRNEWAMVCLACLAWNLKRMAVLHPKFVQSA